MLGNFIQLLSGTSGNRESKLTFTQCKYHKMGASVICKTLHAREQLNSRLVYA